MGRVGYIFINDRSHSTFLSNQSKSIFSSYILLAAVTIRSKVGFVAVKAGVLGSTSSKVKIFF